MNRAFLEQLDAEQRLKYIEYLLRQYRQVDGFWFLEVEKKFGRPQAEEINVDLWKRIGELGAKDILNRFGIQEKGLAGLMKALPYYPWSVIIGYEMELKPEELILSVPECPSQIARKKHDLPEYECREMHWQEFNAFAQVIDPRILVRCEFAPPGPRPADLFCRWRFTIQNK